MKWILGEIEASAKDISWDLVYFRAFQKVELSFFFKKKEKEKKDLRHL